MLFSGDHSTRKRVDLGGRSSKERDRKVLVEQTRLERKRRLELKQQTNAAITIQKCFRGRKAAKHARSQFRKQFCQTFGDGCENVNKHCFNSNSEFLRQFLFFFTASNKKDLRLLVEICRLLLQFSEMNGGVVSLFADKDYITKHSILENRVKKLVYSCLDVVHHNRDRLKNQILMPHEYNTIPAVILFQTVVKLANPDLPWACKVVDHLLHNKVYLMLRGILLTGLKNTNKPEPSASTSPFEHVLILISSHTGQNLCTCSNIDLQWSFSFQLLSIPYFWRHFPHVKEVFTSRKLIMHYIHQIASCLPIHVNILPSVSLEFPGYACLIGNFLDAAGVTLSEPGCSFLMAMDFISVSTFLLESMPKLPSAGEMSIKSEDDMDEDPKETLDMGLLRQISNSIDSRLLQNLVNALFKHTLLSPGSDLSEQSSEEVEAIYAICAFLHVTFNTLRVERIMTGLAYRTDLVPALWNYIRRCHENQRWPTTSKLAVYVPGDSFGWLLPLTVFCPVYKHMLMIIDNEEFYEQEKPLSIRDIKLLVIILKQALWDLLWTIPGAGNVPLSQRSISKEADHKKLTVDFIKDKAKIVVSGLLSQLQDWNNRRLFTTPSDFHAPEATNEMFISQALFENSKASDILKQAPFLVPFTSRVKIFNSQLAVSRQGDGAHVAFPRNRFKIRRDQIFEDAFNHLSKLSEESLRGSIRVSFINEFGAEEAGIDGGGIFKDFMENITRAAFDVQYGLFKETVDHLLYPNPGSGLIHDQHLQYFHFLGTILGKAMYEGVLVDIPFATFFLSKLKEKHNYLNDLPSLDPELYRHLLFLKHYKGDISELEIYFVTVSNEYGENVEEELRPGGKSMRVTNDNVIQFIHLIANHRLNYQIRHQSTHFLRGFQQLIKKEWIEMFSEHEIQLLISGSLDSLDVDDLRLHAQYSGGYHADHPVIEMFWEVLKSFSLEHQMKFLKFVTGCSRGPLLGFSYLDPKFCIQRTASLHLVDADLDRLPTSATCMNLLKLPPYQSKEQMQAKLMYAINADAGFDLS